MRGSADAGGGRLGPPARGERGAGEHAGRVATQNAWGNLLRSKGFSGWLDERQQKRQISIRSSR